MGCIPHRSTALDNVHMKDLVNSSLVEKLEQ
jgi:hypothetical protein